MSIQYVIICYLGWICFDSYTSLESIVHPCNPFWPCKATLFLSYPDMNPSRHCDTCRRQWMHSFYENVCHHLSGVSWLMYPPQSRQDRLTQNAYFTMIAIKCHFDSSADHVFILLCICWGTPIYLTTGKIHNRNAFTLQKECLFLCFWKRWA